MYVTDRITRIRGNDGKEECIIELKELRGRESKAGTAGWGTLLTEWRQCRWLVLRRAILLATGFAVIFRLFGDFIGFLVSILVMLVLIGLTILGRDPFRLGP